MPVTRLPAKLPCPRLRLPAAVLCLLLLAGCGSGEDRLDPLLDEVAIAYIQRQVPADEDGNLLFFNPRQPYAFMPGAALYLKTQAAPGAPARNLTAGLFAAGAAYDVRDLSVSADGKKLLFALRAPAIDDADDEDQPSWNIWQYDSEQDALQRVIRSDLIAEAGQDTAPHYLADGRIVFSSTRQRGLNAIRLDEGKPQFSALDERRNVHASVLHVMDADGSNIRQISDNVSHDHAPVLLANGRILFARHDGMPGRDQINLYTVRPDGSELQLLYGSHSHAGGDGEPPLQFVRAQPLADGRLLVQMLPFDPLGWGGSWWLVDAGRFVDDQVALLPDTGGSGRQPLFPFAVPASGLSPNGRYLSVSPLADNSGRYLVSWNPCRLAVADTSAAQPCTAAALADPAAREAAANAGLWVYDAGDNTQRPVVLPAAGQMVSEAVALAGRPLPDWLADSASDDAFAYLSVRSVYDIDGSDNAPGGTALVRDPLLADYNQLPLRFVRIIKGVGIPDRNTHAFNGAAFGPTGQMRDILGYAPVEPDGSLLVRVPANVPFTLSLLDGNGRRVGVRHNVWLQLRPGETLQCLGCHEAGSDMPHARRSWPASINPGAVADGEIFANTVDNRLPLYGETMAELRSRLLGARPLQPDLLWLDDWTDTTITAAAQPIRIAYRNDDDPSQSLASALPTSEDCLADWHSACRISIDYEAHIQPIWDLPRQELDADGVTVLADYRCATCHDRIDAMGQLQVPPAQLELTSRSSEINNRYLISYTELLIQNLEQEIIDGVLRNREQEVPQLDEQGNPLLDDNGEPLTTLINFPLPRVMSAAGATASSRFFERFADPADSVHFQRLSAIELKLISEWLDIGAQYYNNPFEAP